MRRELWRQTSDYSSYREDDIVEMVEMWDKYLKLRGHSPMFESVNQFLSWCKANFPSTEIITFGDAKSNEQERDEAMFDQDKYWVLYVRERPNFEPILVRKSLHHVSMIKQTIYIWHKGLDVSDTQLSVHYQTQDSYDWVYPSNINVTKRVPELQFA